VLGIFRLLVESGEIAWRDASESARVIASRQDGSRIFGFMPFPETEAFIRRALGSDAAIVDIEEE